VVTLEPRCHPAIARPTPEEASRRAKVSPRAGGSGAERRVGLGSDLLGLAEAKGVAEVVELPSIGLEADSSIFVYGVGSGMDITNRFEGNADVTMGEQDQPTLHSRPMSAHRTARLPRPRRIGMSSTRASKAGAYGGIIASDERAFGVDFNGIHDGGGVATPNKATNGAMGETSRSETFLVSRSSTLLADEASIETIEG